MSCIVIADFFVKPGGSEEFMEWANNDIFPGTRDYEVMFQLKHMLTKMTKIKSRFTKNGKAESIMKSI